jgi:hypothetical protein
MMKIAKILSLLLLVSLMVSGISAKDKATEKSAPPTGPGQMGGGTPGTKPGAGPSGDMMSQHQQIIGEMQASMARLDEGVQAMNKAKGKAKVDAMAKVVNEMANQQKQSTRDMMQMRIRMISGMQGQGGDMMAQHQKMVDEMKAASERLDKKVETMNKATGEDKVGAMADVVNELAAQQKLNYPDMMRMRMMMMRRAAMPQRMMPGGMMPGGMMPGMQNRQTTGTTTHP